LFGALDRGLGVGEQALRVDHVADVDMHVDHRGAERHRHRAIRTMIGKPEPFLDGGPHALGQRAGVVGLGARQQYRNRVLRMTRHPVVLAEILPD